MTTIKPTLNWVAEDFEFATDRKPAALSFTRASAGTCVNAIGLISSVASGVLRHDYDPVTGEYKGWLIEEARTNLLTYSEQFDNAAWMKDGSSVTANVTTSPDGTSSADKLLGSAANSTHGVYQTPTYSAASYTVSVFAKAAELSWIFIQTDNGIAKRAYFNLSTGAVGTVAAGVTATITNMGNGWYRCTCTRTMLAAAGSVYIGLASADNTGTFVGSATQGVYLWGAQLEAGAFATSYIPTTTASATRNADVLTVATSVFGFNASEGTLYVSFDLRALPASGGYSFPASINDGSGANEIASYVDGSNGRLYAAVTSGGVQQALRDMGVVVAGTVYKAALAFAFNDISVVLNGGAASTDDAAAIPTVSTVYIGERASGGYLNGHIRHIAYFPRRLANADLQTITA